MNVMVIAPHPDDEVLGCGGVIARHSAAGTKVHVVVVTKGTIELWSEDEVNGIREEMREAHSILGVNSVSFMEFPAPMLDSIPGYKIADSLGEEIARFSPERVYIPHGGDIHADHRAVFSAALVATRPIHGCPVREVLAYETLSETDWSPPLAGEGFFPNIFVDISSYLDVKLKAMGCYKSQMRAWPHPRTQLAVESLARVRGATVGLDAAESFTLVRRVMAEPDFG